MEINNVLRCKCMHVFERPDFQLMINTLNQAGTTGLFSIPAKSPYLFASIRMQVYSN